MFSLRFEPFTASDLSLGLDTIASTLVGAATQLGPFPPARFANNRRERRIEAPGVSVVELATRTWEPGRDGGWGHSVRWTMEAEAACGPVKLSFSASGWEPVPNGLGLSTEGLDLPTFRHLRARLREELGVERDHSDELWPALSNIEAALAAGMDAFARELYIAALPHTEPRFLCSTPALRQLAASIGDVPDEAR